MIEVHPNLFVGAQEDFAAISEEPGWFIVHACKEPFHRLALGYKGRAADPQHPEYLFAYRGDSLCLNLVDVPDPAFIRGEVISEALNFIAANIGDRKVLVHCNEGVSRAPTIALLWLALYTSQFDACNYDEAAEHFLCIYPQFRPAKGMEGFARALWSAGAESLPALPERPMPEPEPVRERSAGGVIFHM